MAVTQRLAHSSREAPAQTGLTSAEASALLAEFGPNVLAEAPRPSHFRLLTANLVHLFALLLWFGAGLAALAGMPELSVAIVAVVVVNAAFAFAQEYRAERAVEALRRMLPTTARVRRDGGEIDIPAEGIVPGDVLVLRPGDRVSADAELLQRVELRVDNSALTGESWPVAPEREVFAGTHVTAGRGEAVVTATGMETRFGQIASATAQVDTERSPLERQLDRVTRFVAALSIGMGATFFAMAGMLGMGLRERAVFAIGVMVANVPEGLLPTVTLALALGTQRMARRNALVRRLSSVETLGETTVICTDKTGTLTENEMTVQTIWTPDGSIEVEGAGYEPRGRFRRQGRVIDPEPLVPLLRAGLLCNDSRLAPHQGAWEISGDPTEGALMVAAVKSGLDPEQELGKAPRVAEVPFTSERKRMTTVHLVGGERIAYVKGAADVVVARCQLDQSERRLALAAAERMERSAQRVLALAYRRLGPAAQSAGDSVEHELELLGLVGMIDPPRPEVADAVRRCRQAGIRVVMVTGDSGFTGEAVARRIGLVGDGAQVVAGADLRRMSDADLSDLLRTDGLIFARIDPEDKLRIARLLRAAGEVVAMTGDGVNDAPALKQADIGVAMGSGTDVAKETAEMILLDDNFASVVAAVEEGRALYDNIRRFAMYHFCSNVGELLPFLVWGLSGGAIPLPLVVMQVLAIDLGTDMLPAIALGTERAEPGIMLRPPRPRRERLLNARVLARVYGFVGLLEGLAGMAGFFAAYLLAGWRPGAGLTDTGSVYLQATTMTMAGIVMGQVGAGMAMRTNRQSVFSVGLLSNRFLLAGIAFEIGLAVGLIYLPGLNGLFHLAGIGPWHWLLLAVWAPVIFAAEEARKALLRRRDRPAVSAPAASPTALPEA
ncbi:MAG: cation-translocating P-type ATPase [Gaiellales bacterium]